MGQTNLATQKLFMVVRHFDKSKHKKGFITLLSVLIIGAVGVSIAVSLLLMGIDASKSTIIRTRSEQAKGLANACAESGLQHIRNTTSYTGTTLLTIEPGTCSYTITNTGGQSRKIESTGTVETTVRKVRVLINQINPSISVSSWEELADF